MGTGVGGDGPRSDYSSVPGQGLLSSLTLFFLQRTGPRTGVGVSPTSTLSSEHCYLGGDTIVVFLQSTLTVWLFLGRREQIPSPWIRHKGQARETVRVQSCLVNQRVYWVIRGTLVKGCGKQSHHGSSVQDPAEVLLRSLTT